MPKLRQISVRLEDKLAADVERAMSVFNQTRPIIVSSALDHFFNTLDPSQQNDAIRVYLTHTVPADPLARLSTEAARTRSRLKSPGMAEAAEAVTRPVPAEPFIRWSGKPSPSDGFTRCIPLILMTAAAGYFGPGQDAGAGSLDQAEDWVVPGADRRLRKGMFVMRVTGRSMEPIIPDGAYCLFRSITDPLPLGRIVLAERRDAADAETGGSYTVKHLRAVTEPGSRRRAARPRLIPENPSFPAFDFIEEGDQATRVVAEMVEVLRLPESK